MSPSTVVRSRSLHKSTVWLGVPLLIAGTMFATTASAATPDSKSFTAELSGANEIPGPGDPNARGDFAAITTRQTLCYSLTAKRVEPITASHIHVGDATVAGPIAVELKRATKHGVSDCLTAVDDAVDTTLTLSVSELAAIKADPSGFYVNAHNTLFPAGALRGQMHES